MKASLQLSLLALFAAAIFSFSAQADSKVYNVGTEPTFPPFEMLDSASGEITGFDIDLLNAIAADQGFEVKIHALGFDGLIPAVLTGKIDIAASGITITEKRAKVISFSTPYIEAGIGVLIRKDDASIKSLDDLKDKTAGVQIGSSGQKAAEDLKAAGKLASIVVMDNASLAVTDLLKGRVDTVINDIPVNNAFINQSKGKLIMLDKPLNKEEYGFVTGKNNQELLEMINKGLANVRANGTYDKIHAKYFSNK